MNNINLTETNEKCCICEKILMVDDPNDLQGECCNFCYKDICGECYDKEPDNLNPMYGWVCSKCAK